MISHGLTFSTCRQAANIVHEADACTKGKTTKNRGDCIHLAAILEYVVLNSYDGDQRVEILKERRRQVRLFVRCIIDEHRSLKEVGLTNTVSLCRMSSVCSKTDVLMAQQRAASQAQQLAQTYYRKSVQC